MALLRTFIAIELDDELKTNIDRLQERLRDSLGPRSVRWVRPEGIHLTLKFLGDTPKERVGQIQEALGQAAAEVPPFMVRVGGVGCFPNARQPRVVWVGVEEVTGALRRLRDAVESRVSPLGFPTERRAFQPHLTLGRVQQYASRSEVRQVGEVVEATVVDRLDEMEVARVTYLQSDLRPSGAVYTVLCQAELGGR